MVSRETQCGAIIHGIPQKGYNGLLRTVEPMVV